MSKNGLDLPNGWEVRKLGEIYIDRSTTINPEKYPDEMFELYSIPAFSDGLPEIVQGSQIGSSKKSLEPDCVVLSKINPRISRVWIIGNHKDYRKIGSSEWIPFFPVADIRPKYLSYFLQQSAFTNYLAANVSGVGGSLMRIKPNTFYDYPITIAPLRVQDEMITLLESYLSRIDKAEENLKQVQAKLKQYRASVLKAAVEGKLVTTEAELARKEGREYEPASVLLERILKERKRRWIKDAAEKGRAKAEEKAKKAGKTWTEEDDAKALEAERVKATKKYKEPTAPDTDGLPDLPEGWCWVAVDQIADHRLGKMLDKAKNKGTPKPYLRNINVKWFTFDLTAIAKIKVRETEFKNVAARAGDILVCEGGEPGRCAVWPENNEPIVIQKALHRIRPILGIVPQFVCLIIANAANSGRLNSYFTGTTIKHLTGESIKSFPIQLPGKKEQQRIQGSVDKLLDHIDGIGKGVDTSIKKLNMLRQSILKSAFEGKLVAMNEDETD